MKLAIFFFCAALAAVSAQTSQPYTVAVYAVCDPNAETTTMEPTTTTTTPTTTTPTTTTPTTTTPTTTTPTTTTPTTTTPTTTTPTTTTPTTTTPTTTTPTTTTPTTTTPTTTEETTTTPPTTTEETTTTDTVASSAPKDKNFYHVRHPRSVRADEWVRAHVCSGTLVADNDVLTTASCVDAIMALPGFSHIAIATAQNTNSAPAAVGDKFYNAKGIHKHKDYDAATNKNNLAILRLHSTVDMSNDKVKESYVHKEMPEAGTKCGYSFWNQDGAQVYLNATVAVCATSNDDRICATLVTATCPAGSVGGALVCDEKVAGVYSATPALCTDTNRQFHDVSKHEQWVWSVVSGAPTLGLSLVAVLVAVVVSGL